MSLLNIFYVIYPIFCMIAIVVAVASIIVPNDVCDTSKTCQHWNVLVVIFACLAGFSKLFLISVLLMAVVVGSKLYNVWKAKKDKVKPTVFIQNDAMQHLTQQGKFK